MDNRKTMKVAAQLFTIRDYLKTPQDIAKSFHKVKEIGYTAVQVSGMGPIDPAELKEIADREGLTICATHVGYRQLKDDMEGIVQQHKMWGCKYVGLGSMPAEMGATREAYSAFAKEATEIGKRLADHGLNFIYHNHNFEFIRFNGITGLDILLNETDPAYFGFEVDTYWVQAGGANPVDWIKKVSGRMKVVHFKDMGVNSERRQIMAEVGEGNLDWKNIIDTCSKTGVEWCAVEQDICPGDPFDSLAVSLKNLKAMGLK